MNRALRINAYPGNELNHCVDDVSDVANFLVSHCDFQEEEILLLTDKRATTNAIAAHLNWLLTGVNEGDRVVFHYTVGKTDVLGDEAFIPPNTGHRAGR